MLDRADNMMKKVKTPFRSWLEKQNMTVPEFVEAAISRGIITAKANSLYKACRFNPETKKPIVPRNRKYYEAAFSGLKF